MQATVSYLETGSACNRRAGGSHKLCSPLHGQESAQQSGCIGLRCSTNVTTRPRQVQQDTADNMQIVRAHGGFRSKQEKVECAKRYVTGGLQHREASRRRSQDAVCTDSKMAHASPQQTVSSLYTTRASLRRPSNTHREHVEKTQIQQRLD